MTSGGQKILLEAQPDIDIKIIEQVLAEVTSLLKGYTLSPYLLFSHKGIIFRVAHLEPELQIQVDEKTEIEVIPGPEEHFSNLIKVQTLSSLLE